MAEQLAFQQCLVQGRAVELHVGPVLPAAQFVDGPRRQFLARARRPQHQHRGVAFRRPLDDPEHPLHGGRCAHHAREALVRAQQARKLLDAPVLFHHGGDVGDGLHRRDDPAILLQHLGVLEHGDGRAVAPHQGAAFAVLVLAVEQAAPVPAAQRPRAHAGVAVENGAGLPHQFARLVAGQPFQGRVGHQDASVRPHQEEAVVDGVDDLAQEAAGFKCVHDGYSLARRARKLGAVGGGMGRARFRGGYGAVRSTPPMQHRGRCVRHALAQATGARADEEQQGLRLSLRMDMHGLPPTTPYARSVFRHARGARQGPHRGTCRAT